MTTASPELWRRQQHRDDPPVVSSSAVSRYDDLGPPQAGPSSSASAYVSKGWSRRIALDDREPGGGPSSSRGAADDYEGSYYSSGGPRSPPLTCSGSSYDRGDRRPRSPPPYNNYSSGSGPPPSRRGGGGGGGGGGWDSPDHALPPRPSFPSAEGSGSGGGGSRSRYSGGGGRGGPTNEWPERGGGSKAPMYERDAGWSSSANGKGRARLSDEWESAGGGSVRRVGRGSDWESDSQRSVYERDGPPPRSGKWDYQDRAQRQPPPHLGGHSPTRGSFSPHPQRSRHPFSGSNAGSAAYPTPRPSFPPNSYRPLSSTYPNDPYPPPPANGYRGYGPGKRSGWDGSGRDVHDRWNDRAGSAGHDSKLPTSSSALSNGYNYPIAAQDDEREEGERDEDEDVRNIDGGLPSVGGFIYNDKDQMDYGETALSYEDVGVASSPVRPKAKKEPSPVPSSPVHASPSPPPPAARASSSSMDIDRETPTAPPSPPPPPPPAEKATTVSPPSPASLPSESPASTSLPSRPSSPSRPASPLPPPSAINISNLSRASTSPPPPALPSHLSSASKQPLSALTPKSSVVVDFAPPASPVEPAAPAAFAMPPSPPPTASSPTVPPAGSASEWPELVVETAPSEDVEMASPTTKLTTGIVVATAPSIAPVSPLATLEVVPASPVKVPTPPSPAKPVPAVVTSSPPKLPAEGPPPDQHVEPVPKDGVGGGKRKRRKIATAEPEPEAVAMDEDPAEENGDEEQREEQEEDPVVRLVQGRIASNDKLGPAETDSIIATNLALLDPPSSRLPTVTPTITGTSSSSELVPAALAIPLPLEDLPSPQISTAVRVRVQSNRLEAIAKTERLRNEYRTLNTEWRANCARLERLSERRQQQQAALASAKSGAAGSGGGSTYSTNGGGLFGSTSVTSTPGLGSFLDEPGARGSLARTSRSRGPGADLGLGGGIGGYFGDAVRSEAEFQLILASLEEADQMDPNLRAARTTAIVPDMILDEVERDRDSFDDTNGLVLDPEAFFAESVAEWTEEEKAIFQRRFASHPKQFGKIAEHLPNKTAKECVLYYYRTKKTIDYRTIVASRGGSKRKGGRRAGATKASLLLANLDRKKAKPLVPTTRPPVDDTSSTATLRAAADEDSAMESGPSTPGPSASSSVAAEPATCNAPAPTNGRKRSRVEALAGGAEATFTPGVPPDLKRSRFHADHTTPTSTPSSTPTSRRTLDDIADSQSSQNRADPDVLSRPSATSLVLEGSAGSPTPGAGSSGVKRPRPRTKKKTAAPSTLGDPNTVPLPATTTKPRTTVSVSMASVLSSAPSTPADENGLSSHSVSSVTSPAAIIGNDPSLSGQPTMAGATAPTKRKSSSVNSYWSMSEKAGFLKSLEQHGKDWAAISRALASCGTGIGNSKTAVQVRNYFQSNAEQLGLEAVAAEAAGAKEAARGVQALTISSEERKPVLEPFPSRTTGLFAVPPLSPPRRTLSPLMTTAGGDVSRPPSRGMSLFNLLNAPDSPGKTIGSGGIARKGPVSSLDIKPPAGMSLMDSVIGAGARPAVSRYSESLGSPSPGLNGGGSHGHHSTHGHSLGHGPSPPPPRWGPTPPSLFANSSRRSSGGGSSIHDLIHRPSARGIDHAIPSSLPIPPRPYSASSASWAPPPPPHVASSMSASSHPLSHPQPHLPAHPLHHPVSRPAFHAAFDNPAPVGPPFIKNGWHDVQRSTASAGSSGSASPSPAPFPMGGEPIRQHRP